MLSTTESLKWGTSWEAVEAPKSWLRKHLLAQNTVNEPGVEWGKCSPSLWDYTGHNEGRLGLRKGPCPALHRHTTGGEYSVLTGGADDVTGVGSALGYME